MAESASQKKRADKIEKALLLLEKKYEKTLKALDKKPKEVIVEKEVEVPVEVIKEVVVEREVPVEKIVEVEVPKEVEVIKEVERIVEKEVPGPERIVEVKVPGPERRVEVPGPERIKEVVVPLASEQERNYIQQIQALENTIQDISSKEPEIIEKASSNDLREAARLMAQSELNKEDLTEDDIYNLLLKSSEEDVKKKIGFWAMPLPKETDKLDTNKRYLGKK
jgi:hypothetical protein